MEKEVVKTVEVPGETIVVEKEVVKTVEVEVPGETVTVTKEVIKPGFPRYALIGIGIPVRRLNILPVIKVSSA